MNPSEQRALKELLKSPQGKRLVELLQKQGGGTVQQAGAAIARGDSQSAQAILAPLMQNPEIKALLQSLDHTVDHG